MFDTILTTVGLVVTGLMATKVLIAVIEVSVEAYVRRQIAKAKG